MVKRNSRWDSHQMMAWTMVKHGKTGEIPAGSGFAAHRAPGGGGSCRIGGGLQRTDGVEDQSCRGIRREPRGIPGSWHDVRSQRGMGVWEFGSLLWYDDLRCWKMLILNDCSFKIVKKNLVDDYMIYMGFIVWVIGIAMNKWNQRYPIFRQSQIVSMEGMIFGMMLYDVFYLLNDIDGHIQTYIYIYICVMRCDCYDGLWWSYRFSAIYIYNYSCMHVCTYIYIYIQL